MPDSQADAIAALTRRRDQARQDLAAAETDFEARHPQPRLRFGGPDALKPWHAKRAAALKRHAAALARAEKALQNLLQDRHSLL